MSKRYARLLCCICLCVMTLSHQMLKAEKPVTGIHFTLSVKDIPGKLLHVEMDLSGLNSDSLLLRIPAWTTGYYQILDFGNKILGLKASDRTGANIPVERSGTNSWIVHKATHSIRLSYDVLADQNFVATNFLDSSHAYISPAGTFLYPDGAIENRSVVVVRPPVGWAVATGMDAWKAKQQTPYEYHPANFDVLFDSPILIGKLERFPDFRVQGKLHEFVAYDPGELDRDSFMHDLKRLVEAGSGIIGHIPYQHYSFLSIGPGGGGIEHLNSASISFSGRSLTTRERRITVYRFLAHEYFHHYNVKRIRPIKLGPFDYENGSKTRMLWLSEGVTVYYDMLIPRIAGIISREEYLSYLSRSILGYENKPGRWFQTPSEASWNTWSEGPFGRMDAEFNKTISPYDKGPLLGALLDLKIRHQTGNRQSMDSVMRRLYRDFYQAKNRGFTELEFQQTAEQTAGVKLDSFFRYVNTLDQVDYPTYFGYAGLRIDTLTHHDGPAWTGLHWRMRNDSLLIGEVDWLSPAWEQGFRRGQQMLTLNGSADTSIIRKFKPTLGMPYLVQAIIGGTLVEKKLIPVPEPVRSFTISIDPAATPEQVAIRKAWLRE